MDRTARAKWFQRLTRWAALGLAACAAVANPTGCATADGPATDEPERWDAARSSAVSVYLFITTDCPISNGYAPELSRIMERYKPRGVAFLLVYVDPTTTHTTARQHASEYGLDGVVVNDANHDLVRKAGVMVTPEAAVYVGCAETTLPVYVGRIDNLYAGPGNRRAKATTHELADAIEAALARRPVAEARTEAVGCPILDMR